MPSLRGCYLGNASGGEAQSKKAGYRDVGKKAGYTDPFADAGKGERTHEIVHRFEDTNGNRAYTNTKRWWMKAMNVMNNLTETPHLCNFINFYLFQ